MAVSMNSYKCKGRKSGTPSHLPTVPKYHVSKMLLLRAEFPLHAKFGDWGLFQVFLFQTLGLWPTHRISGSCWRPENQICLYPPCAQGPDRIPLCRTAACPKHVPQICGSLEVLVIRCRSGTHQLSSSAVQGTHSANRPMGSMTQSVKTGPFTFSTATKPVWLNCRLKRHCVCNCWALESMSFPLMKYLAHSIRKGTKDFSGLW